MQTATNDFGHVADLVRALQSFVSLDKRLAGVWGGSEQRCLKDETRINGIVALAKVGANTPEDAEVLCNLMKALNDSGEVIDILFGMLTDEQRSNYSDELDARGLTMHADHRRAALAKAGVK